MRLKLCAITAEQKTTMNKTYSGLIKLPSFEERYNYLKLNGSVGTETFGHNRYLNQQFYRSPEWRRFRREIIIRDNGCDLGMSGHDILSSKILIHHINPITVKDIINRSSLLFDKENVICVSEITHNAIHYSDDSLIISMPTERKPNDTCPWKNIKED